MENVREHFRVRLPTITTFNSAPTTAHTVTGKEHKISPGLHRHQALHIVGIHNSATAVV